MPEPRGGDWYANLLWYDRRKCLQLTHAATLFTVFEPDVVAKDLRATQALVVGLIERELTAEGLPAVFGNLGAEELVIAWTADRSVLGCLNDMAYLCEAAVAKAGGLAVTDARSLNHRLQRNINNARGYQPPIELVARLSVL